jgi:GNAT superfamily N-acetyltransferase
VKIISNQLLSTSQKEQLLLLWNSEYPKNIAHRSMIDFEVYLSTLINPKHFLLVDDNNQLIGWSFVFERDKQIWFAIIVDSSFHSQGLGTRMLNKIKKENNELSGWVIDHDKDRKLNGEPYKSPLPFYLKNGFAIDIGNRLELEKISALKINWEKN